MAIPDGFKTKFTTDTKRRRIYFPNVGEVYKTSYRKGVIKEFRKLQDDPIKVAPSVKVEVDGNRSDFIPIFFKPRMGYWDTNQALSWVFNSDEGWYENAWMSFRCDDEVIVQCYEDKPVAVVGFSDGVPRLGEALIKLTGKTVGTKKSIELYLDAAKQTFYRGITGPDGLALNILKDGELIYQEQSDKVESWYFKFEGVKGFEPPWWMYYVDKCASHTSVGVSVSHFSVTDSSNPGWYYQPVTANFTLFTLSTDIYVSFRYPKVKCEWTGITRHYLVVVGPILYVIQTLSVREDKRNPQFDGYVTRSESGSGQIGEAGLVMASMIWAPIPPLPSGMSQSYPWDVERLSRFYEISAQGLNNEYAHLESIGCAMQQEIERQLRVQQKCDEPFDPEGRILLVEIAAAPYTKDLYDSLKGAGKASYSSRVFLGLDASQPFSKFYTPYQGLVRQSQWVRDLDVGNEALLSGMPTYQWQYQWGNRKINPGTLTFVDGIDIPTVKTFTRPHTKADIESLLGAKNG